MAICATRKNGMAEAIPFITNDIIRNELTF